MRPQRQLIEHDPSNGKWGDCHRTAMAARFDMDVEELPHFGDGGPMPDEFNRRVDEWLAQRGLCQVSVPYSCSLADLFSTMGAINKGVFYLLGGRSIIGANHTVLCLEDRIVCDPSGNGIVGPLDDGYLWATFFSPKFGKETIS